MGASDQTLDRERDDPLQAAALVRSGAPERVHYATGVLLDAQDFEDEQTYQRGRFARALAALFGFGTIAGLRVHCKVKDNPDLEVDVLPGLALDRLGRLIEVRRRQCALIKDWLGERAQLDVNDPQRAAVIDAVRGSPAELVLDLFIRYVVCAHGKTPSFAAGPFNATDYVVPARLADAFEIRLELAATGPADALKTPGNALPPLDEKLAELTALSAEPEERTRQRHAWMVDNVLDAWVEPDPTDPSRLVKLAEHAAPSQWNHVLLARVTLPVLQADANAFPTLDAARLVDDAGTRDLADNSLRPIVFIPTAWRGLA